MVFLFSKVSTMLQVEDRPSAGTVSFEPCKNVSAKVDYHWMCYKMTEIPTYLAASLVLGLCVLQSLVRERW